MSNILHNAITIKNAIDSAADELEPLGPSISHKLKWEDDHGYNDSEEEDEENDDSEEEDHGYNDSKEDKKDDEFNWAHKLIETIDKRFDVTAPNFKKGVVDDNILEATTLSTNLFSGCIKDFEKHADKLFETAQDAPFGDMKKMETVVDKSIRCAKDIIDFTLDGPLTNTVEQLWSQSFHPKKVKAIPYKINIYGPGCGFTKHRDTPSKNLVGTFLVGLGDTSDTYLEVKIKSSEYDWKNYETWDSAKMGQWCAFYPDCPHEVKSFKQGLRSTLAFKIFVLEDDDISNIIDGELEHCKKLLEMGNFGILLSHDYSLNSEQLKGTDALWHKAFTKLGATLHIIPVLVKINCTNYEHNRDYNYTSNVFPLTTEHIDCLLGNGELPPPLFDDEINFFSIDKGYQWQYDHQNFAEHVGNECQPEEEDSIYLHRAILIEQN